jgi:penicillin G amidase
MKRAHLLLLTLALPTAIAAAAAGWYLRAAEPKLNGSYTIPALGAPVEVWRDSLGVPHLWAQDETDLFRALGFVHAQDRLFQMEMFRRVAAGRLAELFGREMVDTDRLLRTIGLGRAAALNEKHLDPATRGLLEAYAEGVNSWIRTTRTLPPEFVALRFRPEPWTVRNSLGVAKLMAWDLADWEAPLNLQRAVDRVGPELASALRPPYPAWGEVILPAGTQETEAAEPARAAAGTSIALTPLGISLPDIPPAGREWLEAFSIARASNSWVIGGERTRSGKPIVANDMHLALRAPALWYLAALHGGDLAVAGLTLPGTPGVVAGHSRHVAWGLTNAMVADADFFIEQVDTADSGRYLTPQGWRAFEVRPETIQVRGSEAIVHTVRSTRNGPVLSDVDARAGELVLSLRWAVLEPSAEAGALLQMNRARNAAEFLQAARGFDSPHLNVVFADTNGEIGYRLAGRIPLRRSGDGSLPVPAWTGEYDWLGFLDPERHPEIMNPKRGFIVTANNAAVGSEFPYPIARQWAEPFRAQRIREMLEAGRDFTAADVALQQIDLYDAFALRYLPHAIRAAEQAGETVAAELLRGWNGEARFDSRAAALFYSWYEALRRGVAADEYRGASMYFPRAALNHMLETGDNGWANDVRTPRTETLADQAEAAIKAALRHVDSRQWGDLHETRISHALGRARALDRLVGFNLEPFSKGGSPYTVDVAGYGSRAPFVNTHGASQRHVVDLGDPAATGGYVIPTGQSGIPFSRHYRDQHRLWREGRLWPISLDRDRAAAVTWHRMQLRPEPLPTATARRFEETSAGVENRRK